MITGTSSTVTWGNTKLQVALVLDNSGSMSSAGKMGALKKATHQLLATLKSAATNPGDVQVSLVPFNVDVNIGTTMVKNINSNGSWLDWSLFDAHQADACSNGSCWNGSSWVYVGNGSKKPRTIWKGCVTDRNQPHDTENTTPQNNNSKNNETRFVPEPNLSIACPLAVSPLNYMTGRRLTARSTSWSPAARRIRPSAWHWAGKH